MLTDARSSCYEETNVVRGITKQDMNDYFHTPKEKCDRYKENNRNEQKNVLFPKTLNSVLVPCRSEGQQL